MPYREAQPEAPIKSRGHRRPVGLGTPGPAAEIAFVRRHAEQPRARDKSAEREDDDVRDRFAVSLQALVTAYEGCRSTITASESVMRSHGGEECLRIIDHRVDWLAKEAEEIEDRVRRLLADALARSDRRSVGK